MVAGKDTDPKKGTRWEGAGAFIKQTRLIRTIIATTILFYTLNLLVTMKEDNIALIAILSGIAGSAATFLFSAASNKDS